MTFRCLTDPQTIRFLRTLLLIAPLSIHAQTPAKTPPCSPNDPSSNTASKPCSPPKTVTEQFPFPGESPASSAPDQPETPKPAPDSQAPKEKFPYPGEPGEPTGAPSAPTQSGSGESSSSSPDTPVDPDTKPALKDEGSEGTTRSSRRRLRPPAQKILSDDERVEEDLSVAHFYQQSGNLNGAYLRAKDAVKLQPQTSDAHLALAGIAQRMGKRDEAVAEYTRYLELDPDGDGAKAARKSLEKLKP